MVKNSKMGQRGVRKQQSIGGIHLTELQYRFCYEYMVDFKPVKAAIRAGYSPKGAVPMANRLMKDERLQKAIDILRQEEVKQTKLSKDQLVEHISECASRNAKDLFTDEGILVLNHTILLKRGKAKLDGLTIHDLPDPITRSIDGVKQKCHYNPSTDSIQVQTELKLVGKASAWEMLMKHFGAYQENRVNLNIETQLPEGFYTPSQEVEDVISKEIEGVSEEPLPEG